MCKQTIDNETKGELARVFYRLKITPVSDDNTITAKEARIELCPLCTQLVENFIKGED